MKPPYPGHILRGRQQFSKGKLKLLCLVACLFCLPLTSQAQDEDTVAATVGETKIMASRIQRHIVRTVGERELTSEQLKIIRAEALQHLVNREIVNHYLELRDYKVGPNQIRLEVELLTANLDRFGQTLDEFLAKENRTRESLEHEIVWKLRWDAYLKKTLTDKVMQTYFDGRRKRFDGTEVRVAQILFRTADSNESIEAAMNLARKKKTEIEGGEITWKEAVNRNSIAASREKEGVVGWIRIHEPMPRDFTQRAFALEPDEIAEPFASKFGVHLIKCLEVKPGTAELGDVREQVEVAAKKELFERIAKRHQTEVKIEYAEGWKLP